MDISYTITIHQDGVSISDNGENDEYITISNGTQCVEIRKESGIVGLMRCIERYLLIDKSIYPPH